MNTGKRNAKGGGSGARSGYKSGKKTGGAAGAKSGYRTDKKNDGRSGAKSGYRTDRKNDGRAGAKFGHQTDRKTDGRTGEKAGYRTDRKTDARTGEKTGYRTDKKTDARTGEKAGYRPDRKTEGRAGAKFSHRTDKKTGGGDRMNTRQLVLKILADFDASPNEPERIADKVLSRRFIEQRDRRFIFEIVYGVLRNRIYLDYVIDTFIPTDRALNHDALRRVLQIGAYQILFLDRVPDHAAVNEAVELAKRDKNAAPAAGFVNAVLRNVIKNKHGVVLPDPQIDLSARLSVEFSHPKWMVERWLARYGLTDTKKILAFNNERPAVYLRRSMRGITRQLFELDVRTLCKGGGGYLGLYYKMTKALDPEDLRLFKNGLCVVQAPSSGWAVAMLELQSGGRALDMCCAPGGKTTLMAEIVGENGSVVACDRYMWKMKTVVENINNLRLTNIFPLVCDGVAPPFSAKFKSILLDAPCTGTGVLQRHPDGRFVRTADDVEKMAELQRQLLDSAANMVEGGGDIVYSTCSLEAEENEQQVEWFLNTHPEFKLIPPPDVIPANLIDKNNCLRITPFAHGMDGMFAAKFRKC